MERWRLNKNKLKRFEYSSVDAAIEGQLASECVKYWRDTKEPEKDIRDFLWFIEYGNGGCSYGFSFKEF